MSKILFVLLVLLIMFILFTSIESRVREWSRIPQYFVNKRVTNFLDEHRITNCFEFLETPTNLLLKCWKNNRLTDVSIEILDAEWRDNYDFPMSASI